MDNIWLIVIAVSLGAVAVFIIPLLIELKRTVSALRCTVETSLNPALEELHKNLKTLNAITENINTVTTDVRQFSQAVSEIGRSINIINSTINSAATSAAIRVISLRTGIAATAGYLFTNLLRKGDRR
ncbi:MAG: DUF948 domain-containing protein [Nitrospirae bacterium]|nr:DUF948 domain-containing protein [Nitrospirota bacterium]